VLTRAGLSGSDQLALLAAATALDPRRLRAGQVIHLRRPVQSPAADRVTVRSSPEDRISVRRAGGDSGWVPTAERIAWTPTAVVATGTITRTLYDALDSAVADSVLPRGERVALAWAIADVYDWEIDFTRDVRGGDRVRVLFERLESAEGERRFGRVLAARVEVASRPSYAFWFEPDSGKGGFFDDQGRSLRRAFLRAPLEFRRISSRFGGRYHPIRKSWRSHQGTDYAADAGTPVRATAVGTVVQAGYSGGYGLMVELRHANGIRTRYGHLSRLGVGIRRGAHVTQRQTVGLVGSTGLSTGPHLHYEFLVNGRPTNPQRRDAGTGRSVPAAQRAFFDETRAPCSAGSSRRRSSSPPCRTRREPRRRPRGSTSHPPLSIRGALSRHRRPGRARRAFAARRRSARRGAYLCRRRGSMGALRRPRPRLRCGRQP
jgi:murein DD-endopeptidase MepM/ murein hydrolase activator NlpD